MPAVTLSIYTNAPESPNTLKSPVNVVVVPALNLKNLELGPEKFNVWKPLEPVIDIAPEPLLILVRS